MPGAGKRPVSLKTLLSKPKPSWPGNCSKGQKLIGAFNGKWIGIDSFFGKNTSFRDAIGKKYYYFAEIPCDTQVWLEKPEVGLPPYKGSGPHHKKERPLTDPTPVSEIAKDPCPAWETVNLGKGAKGPLITPVTRLRIIEKKEELPGNERWLFLRKDADKKMKYAFSNAPKEMPLQELAHVAKPPAYIPLFQGFLTNGYSNDRI